LKENKNNYRNSNVDNILGRFRHKLEQRQSKMDNIDNRIAVLDIVLSALDPLVNSIVNVGVNLRSSFQWVLGLGR
jgi:hypothetical protein